MANAGMPTVPPAFALRWTRALKYIARWGMGQGRIPNADIDLVSPAADNSGAWDWSPAPPESYLSVPPGNTLRGLDYTEHLDNAIQDRAGRGLTYGAAQDAALHTGFAPMIEWDAPSIQLTIRRGMVLSTPYMRELQERGVISSSIPTPPPPWTLQGYMYYAGVRRYQNAPTGGRGRNT